jgi:hypothetical protein
VACQDDDAAWARFGDKFRRKKQEFAALKLAATEPQISITSAPASARDAVLAGPVAAGLPREMEDGPPFLRRPGVVHRSAAHEHRTIG